MPAVAEPVTSLPVSDFGGRYVARENADGTFSILNVPIVGELGKGARKDYPDLEINKGWLDSALASLKAGEADDFLPPLNLHHHNSAKPVEHIGFIRAREVRKISYRGKEMFALFADLERVPEGWATQIARGRLPYVSIEGPVKGPGDVKSLAMLTDEPPQFGFPIITVGSVLPLAAADVQLPEPEGPWTRSATPGAAFCFAYESEEDDGEDEKGKDGGKDKGEFGKKGDGDEEGEDGEESEEDEDAISPEDSEKIEQKAMALGLAKILDVLNEIKKALVPPKDAAGGMETGQRGPLDPAHMSETKPETAPIGKDPETAGALAALRSEIATLKADKDAREKEKATVARIAKAKGELVGFHIDATSEAEMAYFADLGDEPLAKYVASVKRNGTKDPEQDVENLAGGSTPLPHGSDDVLATYRQEGGKSLEVALKAARTHARLTAQRTGFSMSLADFVASEVAMAKGEGAFALRAPAGETEVKDED